MYKQVRTLWKYLQTQLLNNKMLKGLKMVSPKKIFFFPFESLTMQPVIYNNGM